MHYSTFIYIFNGFILKKKLVKKTRVFHVDLTYQRDRVRIIRIITHFSPISGYPTHLLGLLLYGLLGAWMVSFSLGLDMTVGVWF